MRATRAFAAIAVLALVAGACGGSTPTAAPSSGGAAAPSEAASQAAGASDGASAPPTPRSRSAGRRPRPARPRSAGTAASAAATRRSRSTVEKQVVEEFNASHPDIHLTFEAVPYAGANDALATEIASGNGPDIVGPVGIGGANAFHGQWLDLAPLIQKNNYDLSGFPQDAVNIYKLDEGQVGIPFAIYPSVLFYAKSLFDEAGLADAAAQVRRQVHDARRLRRSTGTTTRSRKVAQDPDRRQERQGRDRRPASTPPTSSSGASSPSATTCAALGAYFGAGHAGGRPTARPPRSRTPWKAAWKFWYDSMWTDHMSMTGPSLQQPGHQPRGLPVLHRQGRDERELPVVDLRPRGPQGRLGHGHRPVLQREGDLGVQRRHVPDPQGHQAPRRGVRGPDLPPR